MGAPLRLRGDPECTAGAGSLAQGRRGLVPALPRQRGAPSLGGVLGPPPSSGDRRAELTPVLYTVAIALAGEPTAPGNRSGGAVNRKRERPCARSQSASS